MMLIFRVIAAHVFGFPINHLLAIFSMRQKELQSQTKVSAFQTQFLYHEQLLSRLFESQTNLPNTATTRKIALTVRYIKTKFVNFTFP